MMSLKFLILEDSILDAELITALLAESEIECELIQVKTRSEFQAALERGGFDLILSDYSLPGFDGISALVMARQLCPDVPFIFVTATMGEEVAIETLKGGATDYVLKQRLERLIPAVERSLREAAERRARVIAEAELNRREEEFRALVENSPDIIARFDRDLRHLYVNPVVEQATGKSPEMYVGKTHAEVGVPAEICTLWQSSLRQVFATQKEDFFEYDFPAPNDAVGGTLFDHPSLRHRQGRTQTPSDHRIRYYQTRVVPEFNPDGSVQTLLAITRDITQSKLAEQALRAREAQLQQQAEELKRANQVKDEFLAVLSHELRSPLNAILGWAKLLRTRKFSPEIFNRALETIERNAQLQTRLIEDLLDISRIIRGKLTLNPQPVNLETVITNALETVGLSAQTKCIELVFEGAGSASVQGVGEESRGAEGQRGRGATTNYQLPTTNYQLPIVLGDPSRLQQIIWNLLSNAIKFTPSGGRVEVKLQLSKREQGAGSREQGAEGATTNSKFKIQNSKLDCAPRNTLLSSTVNQLPTTNYQLPTTNYAQITVIDTGIGISAEFLPHIFDYFRQADASITRSYGGLGLGLAIVRHLVELHGGTVCAESLGVEQGATFRVMLPLLETAEFGIRNTPALKQATEFGIHDTQLPCTDAQQCTSTDSRLNNIRVLVVEDDRDTREFLALTLEEYGAQLIVVDSAVAALEALEKSLPDILVSDIGMPATDGYTFIQKVRALPPEQGGQIPAIALTAYAREQDRDRAIAAGFQIHLAKPVVTDELVEAIGQLIS
ncbi:response regulator [Chroococcidiopsis sp.]|uniref:hybrid sensor histidine kinase/response regulator n=1 Tax=Chroococcidiopsis sp. TaxID=3088168 RepID=UPI003F39FA7B